MTSQLTYALAVALVVSAGCNRRDDTLAGDAGTTAAELPPAGAPAAVPVTVDAGPPAAPSPRPPPGAAPAPLQRQTPPAAPAQTVGIVEPPLAPWVPESGRLTIVQAPDLARNLGLLDALDAAGAPPDELPPPPP